MRRARGGTERYHPRWLGSARQHYCADPGGPRAMGRRTAGILTSTGRRMGQVLLAAAFLLLNAGLPHPLLAQGPPDATASRTAARRAIRSNTAQAVLHITAIIVPVTVAPPPAVQDRSAREMTIDLPSHGLQMDVTAQWKVWPDRGNAWVKTTTVVPR